MFWKKGFLDNIRNNPDLWGPFWICTSIIFLLSCFGNLSSFISSGVGENKFENNFKFVPYSSIIVYSIGFLLPFLLGMSLKCLGNNDINTI